MRKGEDRQRERARERERERERKREREREIGEREREAYIPAVTDYTQTNTHATNSETINSTYSIFIVNLAYIISAI